jgi:hypothetical protein
MTHADYCEAELHHPHDCATATRIERLRAFAEAVRDEVACAGFVQATLDDRASAAVAHDAHLTDCLHCAAVEALEVPRG